MPTYTFSVDGGAVVYQPTRLVQTRTTQIRNGTPTYTVTNHLSDRGALNDNCVYVISIVNSADISSDILLRVAQVPDMYAYKNSRVLALNNGERVYRTAAWTEHYTNVDFATAGAQLLRDDVNLLVIDFINYIVKFGYGPPGAVYTYPSGERAALAQLIDAWTVAVNNTATAEAALVAANGTVTTTAEVADVQHLRLLAVQEMKAQVDTLAVQSDALWALYLAGRDVCGLLGTYQLPYPNVSPPAINTGIFADYNEFTTVIGPTPSPATAVTAARDQFEVTAIADLQSIKTGFCANDLADALSAYSAAGPIVVAAQQQVTDAENAQAAAYTDRDNAVVAAGKAQAALAAAVADEEAALAVVQATCPTFDPQNPSAALA